MGKNKIKCVVNGKEISLYSHEWEKITGVPAGTIRMRIGNGWAVERALTEQSFRLSIETLEMIGKAMQSGKFETPEKVIEAAVKEFLG